jgi:hypothetical protein
VISSICRLQQRKGLAGCLPGKRTTERSQRALAALIRAGMRKVYEETVLGIYIASIVSKKNAVLVRLIISCGDGSALASASSFDQSFVDRVLSS